MFRKIFKNKRTITRFITSNHIIGSRVECDDDNEDDDDDDDVGGIIGIIIIIQRNASAINQGTLIFKNKKAKQKKKHQTDFGICNLIKW